MGSLPNHVQKEGEKLNGRLSESCTNTVDPCKIHEVWLINLIS